MWNVKSYFLWKIKIQEKKKKIKTSSAAVEIITLKVKCDSVLVTMLLPFVEINKSIT